MSNNKNKIIFLSYSWANKVPADEIDSMFKNLGVVLKRDVRDVPYRTVIRDFMNSISECDFVIMLISDAFLKSDNCMYEAITLLNSNKLELRILPVIVDNAKIFDLDSRNTYYNFWNDRENDRKELSLKHPNIDTISELDRCREVNNKIGRFLDKIKELNVITFESLKKENYKSILNIIGLTESSLLQQLLEIGQLEDSDLQDLRYQEITTQYPDLKYGWFQRAHLAHMRKQKTQAKEYYEKALSLDPDNANFNNNFGTLLCTEFSDFLNGLRHIRSAILIDNTFSPAYNNLGIALDLQGDYKGAN
jgi:tetratricopeptide (TPR) repeat protein